MEEIMKKVSIIYFILTVFCFALFLFMWETRPNHKLFAPDTKKYNHEIDSLNTLISEGRKYKDSLRLERLKSDSLVFTYENKLKSIKPKINETNNSIINLSSDSTINLFSREITGNNYKR